MTRPDAPARHPASGRAALLARIAAAIGGGYGLAAVTAATGALALPAPRSEAVLAGTMAGLLAWTAAAVWAFAARTAGRAWLGLLCPAALLGAIALLSHVGGGR